MKKQKMNDTKLLTASLNTLPGIIFNLIPIAIIIAFIGCCLNTFCIYNPTQIDAFARSIQLTEINDWICLLVPNFLSLLCLLGTAYIIKNKIWKRKPYLLILIATIMAICSITSHIILEILMENYVVEDFPNLALEGGIGYYLYLIGIYAFAILNFAYAIVLNQIAKNKIIIDGINDERKRQAKTVNTDNKKTSE